MKPDWQVLDELAVFLDLDPDKDDSVAAAFDRLGFPYPAEHYAHDLARRVVLELERHHEAGAVVRKYHEDDGLGLLYYEPAPPTATRTRGQGRPSASCTK
ncbi:MAG: hypothetical protein ACJ8H8_33560 [Geminicoccaceae bacterium]